MTERPANDAPSGPESHRDGPTGHPAPLPHNRPPTAAQRRTELRRPRPRTPDIRIGTSTRSTVQRCCNGCSRLLGDVTPNEIHATLDTGMPPDVRAECPTCTPNPPGLSWRLPLPYARPPLRAAARVVARRAALLTARAAEIPPLHAMTIELHHIPPDRHHRNPLNLTATLKPTMDGLVDANIVPEDNPTYVHSSTCHIDPVDRFYWSPNRRLYLLIREVSPPERP